MWSLKQLLRISLVAAASAACPSNSWTPVKQLDAETTGRLFFANDEAILSGTGNVIGTLSQRVTCRRLTFEAHSHPPPHTPGVNYGLYDYSFDASGTSSIAPIVSSNVTFIIGPALE